MSLPRPTAQRLPVVAVVGRPNVGKSTLFNRLTRTRRAIVDSMPGVTRDRLEEPFEWRGHWFLLVDTGGIQLDETEVIPRQVLEQARAAVAEARVVVFLVDARSGLYPVEAEIAALLRKANVPVVVAANKVDRRELEADAGEFHALGLGPVIPISAEQGPGVDDLLDAILEHVPDAPPEPPAVEATRVAVVGRPNVGKSSLVNRLLGSERLIVSEVPGTTRDTVDVRLEVDGHEIVLLDTAGLRRSRSNKDKVDHVARLLAERALTRADMALVMFDATDGITHQDAVVVGMAVEAGAGVVLLANKWDLVGDQEEAWARLQRQVAERLKFAPWVSLIAVSVRTAERLHRVFPEALRIQENRLRRVPTAELNTLIERASAQHQPPQGSGGREFRVKYLTQVATGPPTFVAFTTGGKPHFSWTRYLENRLRESFDLEGTPIRVRYRGGNAKRRG